MRFDIIDKHIDDVTFLINDTWCRENIDWNFTNSNPSTRFNDGKKHTWFSYNKDKNIIEQITFFYVIVHAAHGSGGTNFYKHFYLGEKYISDSESVYPTFEECKQNTLDIITREIDGYKYAVKIRKDRIDIINKLTPL